MAMLPTRSCRISPLKICETSPMPRVLVKLPAVAGDDAGAFLAAMLQGVKAVVSQFGGVGMAENAEDAAIMFWIIVICIAPSLNFRRRGRNAQAKKKVTP